MTTIRANCGRCGTQLLRAGDLHFHWRDDQRPEFTFRCGVCHDEVVGLADEQIVALLRSNGVAGYDRQCDVCARSPIRHDEIQWFEAMLASDVRFAQAFDVLRERLR